MVFVDVEGSTELLVQRGDAAGTAAIGAVLAVARERLEPYEGREVKSLGDGLLFLFTAPRQAVSFAVAVQRALLGRLPAVRIGVNTGEVGGPADDPVGEAVTAAERIAARAQGREVLVSDVVRQLVGTIPGVRFVDRGRVRLKGFPDRWSLHAAVGSESEPEPMPTFGRAAEIALLAGHLDALAAGTGAFVVIEGEAGIGKTHLAGAVARSASALGAQVVRGGADELNRDRPGALVLGLATALSVPIEGFVDSVGLLGGSRGFALGEAVAVAIEDNSVRRPVLVVLEDLQWADDLSMRTVVSLARRVAPLQVAVVATVRPAPRSPLLERFLASQTGSSVARVVLDSLPEAAVTALVASTAGLPPGPLLAGRIAGAAGNPLYVLELLKALEDSGDLQRRGGLVDVADTGLPAPLRATVLARLSSLSGEAVESLRLASLLGREFTLTDLAAVAGRSVVQVASALRGALDSGILSGTSDTLSFRHDLIRDAVYDDMVPAIRRDLHAAAGRALAAAGAPVLQVARQMELGARPGDVAAAEWLVRAATEALTLDHAAGAELLRQALVIAGDDWPDRDRVQAALVAPLASSGRVAEAQHLARRMIERGVDDAAAFALHEALVSVAASSGDLVAAADAARSAMATPGATEVEVAVLECLEANLALLTGRDVAQVRATAAAALETAGTLGADGDALECVAHHTLAMTEGAGGRYDRAINHARSSARLLFRGGVPHYGYLIPDVWEASLLCFADRFDDALEAYDAARVRAERRGALTLLVQTHAAVGHVHVLAGRWDDAIAELEAGLVVSEDTGNHAHDVGYNALLARIALGRGREDEAERRLASGMEALGHGRHLFGVDFLVWVAADILERREDSAGALAMLGEVWDASAAVRGMIGFRLLGPVLARLASETGDAGRASGIVLALEELAVGTGTSSVRGAALRARGLVDRAPEPLVEAVDAYRDSPRRLELAMTCEDAADELFRVGRTEDAAAMLDEAAGVYLEAVAVAEVARIDSSLRQKGIRRRRSRAGKVSHGWDALSPTERIVVDLVTRGLSNPKIGEQLYISRRTVETHLSHVYRKLGVANRAQLAAEAAVRPTSP
jgi:DNA-binding CsgD family transcriptional regulator/tetratricopeptide (TPR) repeat protein